MVGHLARGGGRRSCGLCGAAPTTPWRVPSAPAVRVSPLDRRLRRGGAVSESQQRLAARARKDDVDGPGAAAGADPQAPSGGTASVPPCRFLRSANKPVGGLATAMQFGCKDVMLLSAAAQNLDERARNDVAILAKGILRLDMRARQDLALLGSSFLKLDARAREDTGKLDMQAREKVKRLQQVALELKEIAGKEAEEHWNDGALDADLRLANIRARRRALEDAYLSVLCLLFYVGRRLYFYLRVSDYWLVQLVKNVHNALVRILRMREMKSIPGGKTNSLVTTNKIKHDTYSSTGSVALDRLLELEESYSSMASVLESSDGIDCSDPEELELVVATLLDMEGVDGASGASLLAECAASPDAATRLALADALADAPSVWTLGNVGMGALQRLATDINPSVAAAATKAITELNQQWTEDDTSTFVFPRTFQPGDNFEPLDDSEDL